MSENVDLSFIGQQVARMQAELRTVKDDIKSMRAVIVTRQEWNADRDAIMARLENLEAAVQHGFQQIQAKMDQQHAAILAQLRGDRTMSDYDTDILTWSERQAALLRRRAAGELINEGEIDWPNIAEEIEDVGSERLHSVTSLLVQALRHMLKAEAWPLSRDAPTWRADAIDFRQQAADRFTPSMRQKIDMARLYRQALRAMPETIDGVLPLPVPATCPVTLDELLSE